MATFDYFKAIWKTGPGVVSDAPAWVLAEIDRGLPVWMATHGRDLVGVHLCQQSDLVLGILVSPSAFGGNGSLENARYGSFVHVFATDHPEAATLRVDDVRKLFESTYGAPISDGAVRQQRNFMLFDFPFHEELAKDLFIEKDRVEGGLDARASAPSSAPEAMPAELDSSYTPHEEPESYPLPQHSLSSLLTHRAPDVPAGEQGRLPVDEGLSYEEVIAGMRERLYGSSYTVKRERAIVDPPAPERPAVSPSSSVDALPPDQGLSYGEVIAGMKERLYGSSFPVEREPTLGDAPVPAMRDLSEADAAPLAPRRAWSPIYEAAGLLLAGLLVGVLVVTRPWESEPVDAGLAVREVPTVLIQEASTQRPDPELAGLDPRIEADGSSEITALDIDVPEVQPKAVPLAIEVTTQEAKPKLPSIEPVMPRVIDEPEADLPLLAAMKTKSTPGVVTSGAASSLESAPSSVVSPTPSSVALEPVSANAQVEVVTEPERVTEEEASSATDDPARDFEVAVSDGVSDSLSESSGEILEQGAVTRVGDTSATSSAGGAEADAAPIVAERETKPSDMRLKRERERKRKRILNQINRYR